MRTILLTTLMALLFSVPVYAGDSASYYNPERDGIGIQLTRNGNEIQFFFYLYDDWQGCPGITVPEKGLVTEGNCHENRWFFTDANPINDKSAKDVIEGWLYMAHGVDTPECIPDPNDPFQDICGVGNIVGRFLMERSGDGWRFIIIQFGEILDKDDSIYSTIYDMNTKLFEATD
jgi:hypothetical protein